MTDKPGEQQTVDAYVDEGSREEISVPARHETLERASNRTRDLHRQVVGTEESTRPGELPGIAGRLMTSAGDLPGKYDPPVSLSTHTINVLTTGLTVYVYDRLVRQDGELESEEVRLLIGALALHDANKYVDGAHDVEFDTRHNTEQVLDYYFEQGDPFGIERVLPGESDDELELDIADVKWLVQRTETKDATTGTRGKSTRRVRGLEKYCRAGDAFVSKVHSDGLEAGVEWLDTFLSTDDGSESHAHYLSFHGLEQAVLNHHLLATVKNVIRGDSEYNSIGDLPTHGLILGSTPESVAYLGEEIDRRELRSHVENAVMTRITDKHSFDAKTKWSSFEYDILAEIGTPFAEKRRIIADGYADTLARGSGTDHEFEQVPEGFRESLPELAKVVFRDQTYEESLADYPEMTRVWEYVRESDEYNSFTRKIGYLAELLRRYTGSVEDVDRETLRSELATFAERNRPELREELEPDSSAGTLVVSRFFTGGVSRDPTVPQTEEMCFLCGRPAAQEYKKGNDAFYGTQSYSKRVPAEGTYKKICPVCNLEHAVLRDIIERHDYNTDEDIKIAFVYYDDFVADLSIRGSGDSSGLIRALQADEDDETAAADIADPELVANSLGRQYHLQPLYVDSENARLRQVRELLVDLVDRGFKVVIGKPFAGFRPQSALFADLNPTRRQTNYGADRIESFAALKRVIRLFEVFREVADSDDYRNGREMTRIQSDDFPLLANLVAQNSKYGYDVRALAHEHFLNTHEHEYMNMREVAQKGLDLYGYEFDSRHKKTKIFRRAIDATLDGLNREMTEEQLYEHVTGQVYKASTADADKDHYVQPEHAEAFVTALFEYLRSQNDHGELDKADLSQRRNTLSNTYLFAYDRLLREENSDDDDATTAEPAQSSN